MQKEGDTEHLHHHIHAGLHVDDHAPHEMEEEIVHVPVVLQELRHHHFHVDHHVRHVPVSPVPVKIDQNPVASDDIGNSAKAFHSLEASNVLEVFHSREASKSLDPSLKSFPVMARIAG